LAKKVFPIVCLWIAIGLVLFAAGATARTETASAVLAVSKDKVKVGDTVEVKVAVKKVTDLYGVQFALAFDPAKLKLKSSTMSAEYSHFQNECASCEEGLTPIYPLIRKNMGDTESKPQVKLATFVFEAVSEGDARIELRSLKGVSTERFVNEAGYNDMRAVPIQAAAPLTVEVK